MHRLLWKQSQTRLISIPLIVVADKKNTIGCSDGTSNTNQEPGIMKMQQKKMICSCNLRFWLKIFQSSANFLEESCISRALWALRLLTKGPGRAQAWAILPMSGLGLSKRAWALTHHYSILKFLKNWQKVCLFCLPVVNASSAAPEDELITNIHKIFSRILKTDISFQQKISKKWLKQRMISIKFWITFMLNVFI